MRAQRMSVSQYTSPIANPGTTRMAMHSMYRLKAYQAAARLPVFASTKSGTTASKAPTTSTVCNQRGIRGL